MQSTHKFLNVDNYQVISDEIYQYVVSHTQVLRLEYIFVDQYIDHMLSCCPLLTEFLNNHKLVPKRMAVVVVAASNKIEMHRDTDGRFNPYIRILWPIKNCQGSKTRIWFVPKHDGTVVWYPNNTMYTRFSADQKRLQIDEFELSQPLLFDASYAHSVDPAPGSTEIRISFTMGFDRDLPISKSIQAWSELDYSFLQQGETHETR